jgi:hypothetical protein
MAGRESGYGRQLRVAATVCDTSILVSQTEKNRENRRKVFLGLRCALCFQHIFTLLVVGRL